MEGFGSDGLSQPGMSVYGATKYAVRYLTKALVKENQGTPLVIGYMSPGIVVTDLLTRDLYAPGSAEFDQRRRFLNILADRVDTVAPFLVQGQHDYHFGWHKKTYLALRPQNKGVLIVRSKGDMRLDEADLANGLQVEGTINVHWGGLGLKRDVNT